MTYLCDPPQLLQDRRHRGGGARGGALVATDPADAEPRVGALRVPYACPSAAAVAGVKMRRFEEESRVYQIKSFRWEMRADGCHRRLVCVFVCLRVGRRERVVCVCESG